MKAALALRRRTRPTNWVGLLGFVLVITWGSGAAWGLNPSFVGVNAGATGALGWLVAEGGGSEPPWAQSNEG